MRKMPKMQGKECCLKNCSSGRGMSKHHVDPTLFGQVPELLWLCKRHHKWLHNNYSNEELAIMSMSDQIAVMEHWEERSKYARS